MTPNDRALALLKRWLTPDQWLQLYESNFFDVIAPSGRIYRLRNKQISNITASTTGTRLESWSPYVVFGMYYPTAYEGPVPVADQLLLQKLLIETDEGKLWRTACTGGSPIL